MPFWGRVPIKQGDRGGDTEVAEGSIQVTQGVKQLPQITPG